MVAIVMLQDEASISAPSIKAALYDGWPDTAATESFEHGGNTFALQIGSAAIVGGHMSAPIPRGDIESLVASSWLWKDAAAQLKSHKSHLILTVRVDSSPLDCATLLTRLSAAVFKTAPTAPGIIWVPAKQIVPRALFLSFAAIPDWPLYIWIDFAARKLPLGGTAGYTQGLASLGHLEFEVQESWDSLGDLRERLYSLACYVLGKGAKIKDGDTIGSDEKAVIRARYSESAHRKGQQVINLEWLPSL